MRQPQTLPPEARRLLDFFAGKPDIDLTGLPCSTRALARSGKRGRPDDSSIDYRIPLLILYELRQLGIATPIGLLEREAPTLMPISRRSLERVDRRDRAAMDEALREKPLRERTRLPWGHRTEPKTFVFEVPASRPSGDVSEAVKLRAWVRVENRIGIVFRIDIDSVVVHFVDRNGETCSSEAVPKAMVSRAAYEDIPEPRRHH